MQSFSREAAAAFAQHEIQQRRIDRIKAVRNEEKKLAKQQTVQYTELQQAAQKHIEEELQKQWQTQKNAQLQKLKTQYSKLQSSMGNAHQSAHKTIKTMHTTAVLNHQTLQHQTLIATQRARTALSKLQQKILNEQNERETRAKWRYNAIKLAETHRQKLATQLHHQYILLPPGLSPLNPIHDTNNNNNNNNNNNRRNAKHSDPRFNQSHRRYTLITSHHTKASVDATQFNPHPTLYLRQMEDDQATAQHMNPNTEHSKTYNLSQYAPPKLLKKLNKRYNKKRKKHKRRKKQQKKFKAAGITLKSDGTQMLSIPEDQTLSSEQGTASPASMERTMFHSIPSHIQRKSETTHSVPDHHTMNPWDKAKEIRQQTAEKEKKQTQQFLKAQQRGKIALEKEMQKSNAKQVECDLELIHQKLIQQKLEKCQKIHESTNKSNDCSNKLQAELEEKFEDLFQIHSKPPVILDEMKEENIQNMNAQSAENQEDEENKTMDHEMKPRNNPPQPQSYASSSSSSQSLSPRSVLVSTNINVAEKKKKPQVECTPCVKHVAPKPIPTFKPISVSIPSGKACEEVLSNDMKESLEMKQNESESDDDDDSLSVTRSRRVKIQRNSDGSTSLSESTSIATSMSPSPPRKEHRDQVIVPKKWFESLVKQVRTEDGRVDESSSTITSQTVDLQNINITSHGKDQVAMNRTWFERLLQDVYKKKKDPLMNDTDLTPHKERNEMENADTSSIHHHHMDASLSKQTTESNTEDDDEYNLIFKRKKPISVLSEMMSDLDANDADDEYDPNQKPNNLRQSMDSDVYPMNHSESEESASDVSCINIHNANQFIRESAALLNQTANFFDNFSDGSSSMDFAKTDQSLKKNDIDSLLRASTQSDSSQWSLSSLSSMEFSHLPASLKKFENFLSDSKSKNTEHKNMKTPMQTIKEIPTPSSSSTFTLRSNINDSAPPDTPMPFDGSILEANRTKNVRFEDQNTSNLDYHSEEEKASLVVSSTNNKADDTKLTKEHFITPTNTLTTESKTAVKSTNESSSNPSNPRFTDGTVNSYPSLPPSNRGSKLNHNQPNNQSLLPIEHLDFMDIKVSNTNTNSHTNTTHSNTEEESGNEQSSISLNELKKFNDEMNDTLHQILELKINNNETHGSSESFLHETARQESDNTTHDNDVLDSLNVSEIEVSKSSETVGYDVITKLADLSTGSFSLSTFMNDEASNEFEKHQTKDSSMLSSMNMTLLEDDMTKTKFPPLTPQDLEMDPHAAKDDQPSLNKTVEIDDDDMELEDTHDTHDIRHAQQTLQRQHAGYFESEEEDDASRAKQMNATQNVASWNTKDNMNTDGYYQSFRFKYDSINSLNDAMRSHRAMNDNDIMCVGDLEIVKEEPVSESNKNYAEFVGMDSEETQNDTESPGVSLQNAWCSFKASSSNMMESTASQLSQSKSEIGRKLEKLKQREKKKKTMEVQ